MLRTVLQPVSKGPITASLMDPNFTAEVIKRSGTSPGLCWHCRCCAAGCPFLQAMDIEPNGVIRLVQLGLKERALSCSAIWVCVGCHTCSSECPMAIDISAVMDTLRQMALEEGIDVVEPDILRFHEEVLKSLKRHGRAHKLEIMLRYKVRKRDWLSDMDVGLKMLAKRKLDLMPSKIKKIGDLKKIFVKESM